MTDLVATLAPAGVSMGGRRASLKFGSERLIVKNGTVQGSFSAARDVVMVFNLVAFIEPDSTKLHLWYSNRYG